MKAFLKNYRQSPRKVRLVAGLIKGKRVVEAFVILDTLPKRGSLPMKKLLKSAVANATSTGISEDNLFVDNVTVNKGIVLKRIMPRARGSASRINKRTSHIEIKLTEKSEKKVKIKKESEVKVKPELKKEGESTKSTKKVRSESKSDKTVKKVEKSKK